jgi:hypothetical protein
MISLVIIISGSQDSLAQRISLVSISLTAS